MKINLKYLIPLFFVTACKEKNNIADETPAPLYSKPITVPLNTTKGYSINSITGDSIKPLFNSYGDTVKTGTLIPFEAAITDTIHTTATKNKIAVKPVQKVIKNNIHVLPGDLITIPVDTSMLKKVIAGKGIAIKVTSRKVPSREPQPVKALPLRYKDAATANIQYLDVEQGMSFSYITSLLEDKKGFLWFGTDGGGITKYDGVSFFHYGQKEGLSDNIVISMQEDKNGNIWVGTNNGLNKFDGENFTQYLNLTGDKKINSITAARNGIIWLGTNNGLIRYDGNGFTKFTVKEGMLNDTVLSCIEDKNGNIWIGGIHGVSKFDEKYFTHYSKKDGLIQDVVYSLLEDSKGSIWMGCRTGVTKFDGKKFTHYTPKDGFPDNAETLSIVEDRNSNIWFGTIFGGVVKFDGKSFIQYNLAEGLSNNKVRKLIKDRNGNIWFGTDGGGVNKLADAGLSYLSHNEVLDTNRVRPIIKDKKGNIWFGTEGNGIGKYDAAGFSASSAAFNYYVINNIPPFNGHRSLLEDKNGNIWIGTSDGGIYKYDGTYFIDYSDNESKKENTIFSILEDWKGQLWFARKNEGITQYDGNAFSHYTEKSGLSAKKIFSLFEDRNKHLWFGTDGGGLCKYDGKKLMIYSEKEGLFAKSITSIIGDEDGNLWLGLLGAGVCRFDGKQFTYYTEKQGLSNNHVWSLIKDSSGTIWAGTDKGINQFVFQNGSYTIYNYGLQNGLKAADFNLHSACIDNNNRIWWGTGKNIVTKDLSKPFRMEQVHALNLSYIKINDRFYDYRHFPDSLHTKITFSPVAPFSNIPANLKLSYDQNHLSFHFSAIDWSAPDKIKYSYRMVGLDEKWSKPTEETIADYRNLSHGKYQFQVMAIGQSQVWTTPLTYSFTIRPAWWQTVWFKTIVIGFLLTLIFFIARFIYNYQLRRQQAAMEKQLAVQYERQRISAEMHDDIGAGLSGIRLLTEMTKNKVKDEQAAEEVEKIYQSVGDISSKMKEVIWSLNTENDQLPNLLSYLQKQVRLWLEHYPANVSIVLPDAIPVVEIDGETRRNVLLIVKEAIHNIIKHSGASKVDIQMSCTKELLRISISDNGKGLGTADTNGSGNGMKNMRQRIEKLKGKFFIKNEEGLKLIVEIPLPPPL